MKKHINPFKGVILLALALAPCLSHAGDGENVEKNAPSLKPITWALMTACQLTINSEMWW